MTTARAARILVVDDDPNVREAVSRLLVSRGYDPVLARDGSEALELALAEPPDLILTDVKMPGMDGFELCRRVRASPVLEGVMLLVLTGQADTPSVVAGLDLGADDSLAKPASSEEVLARIAALLRLKRRHDALRSARAEAERLRQEAEAGFEQLLALLAHLLDLGLPGASDRGARRAAWAAELAERFDIPVELRRDLELAARLFEVGRLADPDREMHDAPGGTSGWKMTARSVAVLRPVSRLSGVGEVLAAVHENWDGSGVPGHRQRGQIPLRSRIVRTLVDFMAELDSAGRDAPPIEYAEAMNRLRSRAGTLYDPAVLNQLEGLVGDGPGASQQRLKRCVAVEGLLPGMVLAEDLYTNAGVKLMAKGTVVSLGSLQLILDRHSGDPIIGGAWIEAAAGR